MPSQVARHLRSALHLLRGAYPVAASATATTPAAPPASTRYDVLRAVAFESLRGLERVLRLEVVVRLLLCLVLLKVLALQ